MKERLQILTHLRKYPKLTINSNHELYGACRHKTKFHRYENSIFISADESHQGSKRIDETSNGNLTSQCIKCTSSISTYSESENSGRESELSPSTGSSLDTPGSTSSRDTYNNFMKFDVWFFRACFKMWKIKVGNFNNHNSYAVISPILISSEEGANQPGCSLPSCPLP